MLGGTLFKRFILGAKGWEQIPLIDWYKAFGNLEAVSFVVVIESKWNELVISLGRM